MDPDETKSTLKRREALCARMCLQQEASVTCSRWKPSGEMSSDRRSLLRSDYRMGSGVEPRDDSAKIKPGRRTAGLASWWCINRRVWGSVCSLKLKEVALSWPRTKLERARVRPCGCAACSQLIFCVIWIFCCVKFCPGVPRLGDWKPNLRWRRRCAALLLSTRHLIFPNRQRV